MDSTDRPRDRNLWDCDSCLYDSFELRSFKLQLDSAISNRCMSMPRLSDPEPATPAAAKAPQAPKKQRRVLRSVQRLIRTVFRSKSSAGVLNLDAGLDARYLRLGGLSTIPEATEKAPESPELDPLVRRTVSERFTGPTGVLMP